ncbi:MAG TPA: ABC transporter ATP-binding protein [Pirellulales bacterium]|nr:ABC transporter ATP-binding protein [Pirellulales bacterium]
MNSASAVVAADAVSMTFPGGVQALGDISFTFRQGEFISLVGPSGCGKSTLLRLIAGLAKPSQGALTVAGQPPEQARRRKAMLSFVFQDATLLPWRTAADNVRLPLELAGVARGEQERRIGEGLSMVGLSDFARAHPRQLSGGMRMRVSLARALVTRPELILLDEPFGALDDITRQSLNEELLGLWNKHRWTAVFVTHNISEAAFLSTRILVMSSRPGRVVADLPVPFAAPRRAELRAEAEFARFVGEVGHLLRKGRA